MTLTMKVIRLKNRRVSMARLPDGSFAFQFRILDKQAEKGQRVRVTRLCLSPEAMDAVASLYMCEIGTI